MRQLSTRGFSLLEFVGVMIVVAVLALIAIPIYNSYVERGKFTDIVQQGDSYKTAVANCISQTGDTENCNSGKHGIPSQ